MPKRRPPHPAIPDVFAVTREGGAGLTPFEVRSPDLLAPTRGVRIRADVDCLDAARLASALIVGPPDALLSDVAAAQLWDLPLPPWMGLNTDTVAVSVAVAAGAVRPRRPGVRGGRLLLPASHVTELHGHQVTTPARTWLDCAAVIPFEHLVAMGDAVLRRDLASLPELRHLSTRARRRRGVVNVRRALPMLDGRAASPQESIVRVHLLEAGLPAPECNADIVVNGEWLARGDLVWADRRLIVEYDGSVHNSERQRRIDAQRRNLLLQAGWRVLTFTAADLVRPWVMVAMVRQELLRPW